MTHPLSDRLRRQSAEMRAFSMFAAEDLLNDAITEIEALSARLEKAEKNLTAWIEGCDDYLTTRLDTGVIARRGAYKDALGLLRREQT